MLVAVTATHWRLIRAKLLLAGMPDPLRSIPDMHGLLDVAEHLVSEGMSADDLEQFHFKMYRPDPSEKPKGFEASTQLDAFAAFEAAAGDEG